MKFMIQNCLNKYLIKVWLERERERSFDLVGFVGLFRLNKDKKIYFCFIYFFFSLKNDSFKITKISHVSKIS